jgi:DNA-3-methyladenine glycosylase II
LLLLTFEAKDTDKEASKTNQREEKMEEITIKPKQPYNFKLSLDFLIRRGEGPFPEVRKNDSLLRAFRIDNKMIPVRIFSVGTVEKPKLKISTTKLSTRETDELQKKICIYLGLEEDLKELYSFMDKDKRLREIKYALYGFKAPAMGATIYEVIVKAVVQQQISLRIASYMISKLVKKFGEFVEFRGEKYYDFPLPHALANASIPELRSCGLSGRKTGCIINFSREVVKENFNPEEMRKWKRMKVVEELVKFRGIGRWTAELVAIAGAGKDAVPADDLGIRKAISKYYFRNEIPKPETIREITSRWPKELSVYLLYAYRLDI